MTSVRAVFATLLAAVALGGLGLAPAAFGAGPVGTVDGIRVTPCRGATALTFVVFVRGVGCDAALRRIAVTANRDRACPPRWTARKGERVRLGQRRSPPVTLCTRQGRAFTYHLPVG